MVAEMQLEIAGEKLQFVLTVEKEFSTFLAAACSSINIYTKRYC